MRRMSKFGVVVLALAGCVFVGCQTQESHSVSHPDKASDVVTFTGKPPVWMFIPFPTIIEESHGFPAQILMPPSSRFPTNPVEVVVTGEVVSPGVVKLPRSCTVLQLINHVGGFTGFAFNRRANVTKKSGDSVTLYFHWRRTPDGRFRQVWYDEIRGEQLVSPKDSNRVPKGDYILEDGDKLHIRRTM